MKTLKIYILVAICFISLATYSQIDYFGQTPPGDTALIFAKDVISKSNSHSDLVISPDGKEIFWNVANFITWEAKIYSVNYKDGKWSDPEIPSFAKEGIVPRVVFSPDGKKLFYNYRANTNSAWTVKYVEKLESEWSEPKSDGFLIQTDWSFTTNGKVYYSDEMASSPWGHGIYSANYSVTGLLNIQALPTTINSANIINYTPCIAPDESFLLFASNRPRTGGVDVNMYIYISFNNNGIWSTPQKINSAINFSGKARLPSFSPDGKYLFFCGDDKNYYWVSTKFVPELKRKIYTPKLSKKIPDTTITIDSTLNYVIPGNTFTCEYGVETLTYTASSEDGSDLPTGLTFNTNTLSGKPTQTGEFNIKITATNRDTVSVSDVFKLTVVQGTTSFEYNTNEVVLIYPNPAHNKVFIESTNHDISNSYYRIFDITGANLQEGYLSSNSIDISELKTGTYLLQLNTNTDLITQKIVIE